MYGHLKYSSDWKLLLGHCLEIIHVTPLEDKYDDIFYCVLSYEMTL